MRSGPDFLGEETPSHVKRSFFRIEEKRTTRGRNLIVTIARNSGIPRRPVGNSMANLPIGRKKARGQ